jgi:hypothetical protein
MKVKGYELQQFMDEAWPGDDWFWDHDLFEEPDPNSIYDTDEIGPVLYGGAMPERDDPTDGHGHDLAVLLRRWRKARTTSSLLVECPKDRVDAVVAAIKEMGLKVRA